MMCILCADRDAYGTCRPRNENPDPFPRLSNGFIDESEMAQTDKDVLQTKLHPYRRLCKLTQQMFEEQGEATGLTKMKSLAIDALNLFEMEQPQLQACQIESCMMTCELCMVRAAYGNLRPANGI